MSIADDMLEMKRLRKDFINYEATLLKIYAQLLDKALDSKDIHAEIQEVRNRLQEHSTRLETIAEDIL